MMMEIIVSTFYRSAKFMLTKINPSITLLSVTKVMKSYFHCKGRNLY